MEQKSFEAAIKSLKIEAEAINDIPGYIDKEAFGKAVDVLAHCGRIMTCASGSSGIAAKKFAHSLCCIERGAQFMPPCEAAHGGLGALKRGDCIVIVSRGGKTSELLPVMNAAKSRCAALIAVTENMESPLAKCADIILPLKISRESDKFNYMATASYVATIAIFDALICALMEETGYRREMFAEIHPGGAVGAMLEKEVKSE